MTPDQLITFATVAEHLNISRAAVALHLSQPAVSGQLRALQEEFGEPLYHRDGRGVRLTPSGTQLAEYAARLRETYREAQAYRDALRGLERGMLRVGASTTLASYVLPYLIAAFQGRFPEISIQTALGNTGDIVNFLATLDIAMIEGPPGASLPPGTGMHAWREDEIVAIVPREHPLAQRVLSPTDAAHTTTNTRDKRKRRADTATFAELARYPLVLREAGSGVRQLIEQEFMRHDLPVRVALEVAGVEGVKEAVRAGMGIGFVSAMSMRHEDGALCRVSLSPAALTRRFSILVPRESAPSRAAEAFLALCLAWEG
jgi:DNA-binding transcriptional LysR family regulator